MANRSRSGWRGIPWHRCDRCGCDTPTSCLVRQRGKILCTLNDCVDNPLIWNRPGIIAENLNFGSDDEMAPAPILTQNVNDDMEDSLI